MKNIRINIQSLWKVLDLIFIWRQGPMKFQNTNSGIHWINKEVSELQSLTPYISLEPKHIQNLVQYLPPFDFIKISFFQNNQQLGLLD